jgi:hypothetical protein
MRTFGEALDKAKKRFALYRKPQYIIYNHVRNIYRVSGTDKYSINEELANYVNNL